MTEWMTVDDLSKYLQVAQNKIRHLMKQGGIPFHNKLGSPRFFKPEIDDWMTTPMDEDQRTTDEKKLFKYGGKSINGYMLTASKILIGQTALNRWPDFVKMAVTECKKMDRPYLYQKELGSLMKNSKDYLRLSCQLGLIDNRKEWEREKHYYPTAYAEKIRLEKDTEMIKKIILDSILNLVENKLETIPQERHSIFLLWYLLKLRERGLEPEESHFNKGGETNFYPRIRLNYSVSFSNFLFGGDRSREQEFLRKWDNYIKTKSD